MKNPEFDRRKLAAAMAAVLVALLVAPARGAAADPTVLYVDRDATAGANDGTSWADAYTTLQGALDESNANGSTLYEIWVAEGTYYPDEGGSHVNNSRTESFRLSYDNVQLYGGFAGGETARGERDWAAHPIVLSGDIDQDSTLANNAYHVVYLDGETNVPIGGATVIDGFTITAGNANGAFPDDSGGGLYCAGRGSGHACSPALTNVTFSGNTAGAGGGMFNDGSNSGTSSPALTDVTFSGNTGTVFGGGMSNYGSYSGTSNPYLMNVTFSGNAATIGGGMSNYGTYSGSSNPGLTNVTFSGNTGTTYGGGMYSNGYSGISMPALYNVTFSGNTAGAGGGMYSSGTGGISIPTLVNSILWGDSGGEIYDDSATSIITFTAPAISAPAHPPTSAA
jgi:predicted outer membrane repeat protein